MNAKAVILAILIILCAFGWACSMGKKPDQSGPKIGSQAIDFTLTSLDGKKVTLSDLKGKVVLLNFFSIGCPPCRDEMPSFTKLNDELRGMNFALIAVNLDSGEYDPVKQFIKENGYTFTVLYDADGSVSYKYMVTRIPDTFIIDKQGKIVANEIGSRDWASKNNIEQIKALIKE